jgi:cell division protein FtsQ
MGSKRGAATGVGVLEAPEDEFPYEVDASSRRSARRAALRRMPEQAEEDTDPYEEPAFRRQQSGYKLRMRKGLPKSWVGRAVFAGGVLAVMGVVLAGLAGLRSALLHDSRFVVATSSDIQISGNEHVTRAEVLSVFAGDLERNIFRMPMAERRADLERLPWVAHASVMRLLPDQIRVAITERTPVAFVRQGSRIGLVDANGVLLDMPENAAGDPHYSFPVLTGLSAGDPLSTRAARMEIYQRFLRELDSGGEGFSRSLSEVDVSNPEDVKAVVTSGSSDILVHFGDENFLQRYREFEQHLPEWKQQYPKLASADMRYERQVVLEMQPGTGVPVTGDATSSTTPTAPVAENASATPAAHAAPGVSRSVDHTTDTRRAPSTIKRAAIKKTAAKRTAGRSSSANSRMFAELAAERRAQQARAAKHPTAAGAR